jgi:succinate dehydrogenase/fumarate reductase cytochrome b subunit
MWEKIKKILLASFGLYILLCVLLCVIVNSLNGVSSFNVDSNYIKYMIWKGVFMVVIAVIYLIYRLIARR